MNISNKNLLLLIVMMLISSMGCKKSQKNELNNVQPGQSQSNELPEGDYISTKEAKEYATNLLALAASGVEVIMFFDENGQASAMYELSIETPAEGYDDNPEKLSLTDANAEHVIINGRRYSLPKGYVSVRGIETQAGQKVPLGDTKALGKGSQGTAFLVRHVETDSVWALKFDNETISKSPKLSRDYLSSVSQTFVKDDVDVADSLRRGFGNEVFAHVLETQVGDGKIGGIPVVIKTGITGGTLKEALEKGTFLADDDLGRSMRADLPQLFESMAGDLRVYADLNPDNIMWNKDLKKWVIIDAKPPEQVKSFFAAWQGNIDSFLEKLPVGTDFGGYSKRRSLFNAFNRGLYLPDIDQVKFGDVKSYISDAIHLDAAKLGANEAIPDNIDGLSNKQKIILLSTKADIDELKVPESEKALIRQRRIELRQLIVKEALDNDLPRGTGSLTQAHNALISMSEADIKELNLSADAYNNALARRQALQRLIVEASAESIIPAGKRLSSFQKIFLTMPEVEIRRLGLPDEQISKALRFRQQLSQTLRIRSR